MAAARCSALWRSGGANWTTASATIYVISSAGKVFNKDETTRKAYTTPVMAVESLWACLTSTPARALAPLEGCQSVLSWVVLEQALEAARLARWLGMLLEVVLWEALLVALQALLVAICLAKALKAPTSRSISSRTKGVTGHIRTKFPNLDINKAVHMVINMDRPRCVTLNIPTADTKSSIRATSKTVGRGIQVMASSRRPMFVHSKTVATRSVLSVVTSIPAVPGTAKSRSSVSTRRVAKSRTRRPSMVARTRTRAMMMMTVTTTTAKTISRRSRRSRGRRRRSA